MLSLMLGAYMIQVVIDMIIIKRGLKRFLAMVSPLSLAALVLFIR